MGSEAEGCSKDKRWSLQGMTALVTDGTKGIGSTLVEWGGQVYSSNGKKKPHTKTGMGSGQFASGLRGNACYMDNIATLLISQCNSSIHSG